MARLTTSGEVQTAARSAPTSRWPVLPSSYELHPVPCAPKPPAMFGTKSPLGHKHLFRGVDLNGTLRGPRNSPANDRNYQRAFRSAQNRHKTRIGIVRAPVPK